MKEKNINSKSLIISLFVVSLLSILLMFYISSYANNASQLESVDGTPKSECIKNGGKWGGITTYTSGGTKHTNYFCYN